MAAKNGHGGARKGAGRKSYAEKFKDLVDQGAEIAAKNGPAMMQALVRLGKGGIEVTRIKQERVRVVDEKGERFEMVVVEAVTEKTLPDRAAAQYVIDRIMGKPVATIDHDTPEDSPFAEIFRRSVETVYGDDGDGAPSEQ